VAALNVAFTAGVIMPSREAMASGPSVFFHDETKFSFTGFLKNN
jgi:hypothetical protein